MREYLHLIRKGLLPLVVGTVMNNYDSSAKANEYIHSFVKHVDKGQVIGKNKETEEDNVTKKIALCEEESLEQCITDVRELEYKPQEKCRLQVGEYRIPASGLRGLIGVSQMKLKDSDFVNVRKPERSYGRQELVDVINYSACVMQEVYGTQLMVHDLSREGGGRLRPHKSHRNGRDADVGIYGYDVARGEYYNTTHSIKKKGRLHPNFDNDRALDANWLFLDSLVGGQYEIDMIFLDRALINGLRSYVVGKYGADNWKKVGKVLRHEPGHATHYHIRTKVPVRESKT